MSGTTALQHQYEELLEELLAEMKAERDEAREIADFWWGEAGFNASQGEHPEPLPWHREEGE